MRITSSTLIILPACLVVAYFLFPDNELDREFARPAIESQSLQLEEIPEKTNAAAGSSNLANSSETEADKLKNLLLTKFGPTIHHRHTQVKAIEKLVSYLKAKYPQEWQQLLEAYLLEFFPEKADSMLALHESMTEYNMWVESERLSLQAMTAEERRELIWDMRHNFFGDAAEEIWSEALKNERLADRLGNLSNEGNATSAVEKAAKYVDAIEQVYGEQSANVIKHRRQELTDRFLSVAAVQQQLGNLPQQARRDELNEIRKTLGMDAPALQRWRELDLERDLRWERGSEYMKRRAQLLEAGGTEDSSEELAELQYQYFGEEAEIIRNEEQSGYFRYDEKQVYGRN